MPATKKSIAAKSAPVAAKKTAAQVRKQEAARLAKIEAVQSDLRPVKTVLNRSQLMEHLAAETELSKRDVLKVYNALINTALGSIMPRGVGEFTFPGFQKLVTKKVPASKGGKLVKSPFSGEMVKTKPKAATVRVRARLLTRTKQAALPLK